jgi:TorA maturation chaperone TorD
MTALPETAELLLASRHFQYALTARVFATTPDEHLLELTLEAHAAEEFGLLDDTFAGQGTELWQKLPALIRSDPALLQQLTREYTRLFLGPDAPLVPPWESVIISGEPVLFQPSILLVREAYQRAGFQASDYRHEADDHLAIELDFMTQLARQTLEAFYEGDAARTTELLEWQEDFLREHLLRWVGPFAERLEETEVLSCFYPTFARLTCLVCERDALMLKELRAA